MPTYTYTSGQLTTLTQGSLVDAYLLQNAGSSEDTDLVTFVSAFDPESQTYMSVNYHTAYAKVLEKAVLDKLDTAVVAGALTFGGFLTINNTTNPLTMNQLLGVTLGPDVDPNTVYTDHNNYFYQFTTDATYVITIAGTGTEYTIFNGTIVILNSTDSGTTWTLKFVDSPGDVSSNTLVPTPTSLGYSLNTPAGFISSTDQNISVAPGGSTGTYDVTLNVSNFSSAIESNVTSNVLGNFVANADLVNIIADLNTQLGGIYNALIVMNNMMANMNSTFFNGSGPYDMNLSSTTPYTSDPTASGIDQFPAGNV